MAYPSIALPCYATRYLNREQTKIQCTGANNHQGAHHAYYGSVGYAWETNGWAQCPIIHAVNDVRCLAHQGHGPHHQGISQHGGELVKWTRVVRQDESDLDKPGLRSQGYLDDLQKRALSGYVTAPNPEVSAPSLKWDDLRESMEGLYQFDQSAITRAMLHQPPTEAQLKQWRFEELITKTLLGTEIKLTDGAPTAEQTEARSYEERKARRNRRNR